LDTVAFPLARFARLKIHMLNSLTHLCLDPELLQSPRQVLLPQVQQQPKGGEIAVSRGEAQRRRRDSRS